MRAKKSFFTPCTKLTIRTNLFSGSRSAHRTKCQCSSRTKNQEKTPFSPQQNFFLCFATFDPSHGTAAVRTHTNPWKILHHACLAICNYKKCYMQDLLNFARPAISDLFWILHIRFYVQDFPPPKIHLTFGHVTHAPVPPPTSPVPPAVPPTSHPYLPSICLTSFFPLSILAFPDFP